jgi:hypothetical protein
LRNAAERFLSRDCNFAILFQRLQPLGEDGFSFVTQFELFVGRVGWVAMVYSCLTLSRISTGELWLGAGRQGSQQKAANHMRT